MRINRNSSVQTITCTIPKLEENSTANSRDLEKCSENVIRILTICKMYGVWENETGSTASLHVDHVSGNTASKALDYGPGTTVSMGIDTGNSTTASMTIGSSITVALYIGAFLMNISGNATIIFAIAKFSWLKHNMYVALQALAVADLLVSGHICLECVRQYSRTLFPGISYPVINYLQVLLILGASYHVVLVAIERFVAIMFPFQYTTYVTPKVIWVSSGFTYLFALLLSTPSFLMNFAHIMNVKLSRKGIYIAGSFSIVFGYSLLALLLFILHGRVTYIAKQQRRRVEALTDGQERKPGVDRATKMMIIVVGVYLLLWAPFTFSSTAAVILLRHNDALEFLQKYGLVLGTYNSSVNFIIYTAFNRKLRMAFRKILNCGQNAEIEDNAHN